MIEFNISLIIFLSIVETIIDLVILKLIGLKQVTFIINIVLNFIIPILTIWLIGISDIPFPEGLINNVVDKGVFVSISLYLVSSLN